MTTDPTEAERRYLVRLAREMNRPVGVMAMFVKARRRCWYCDSPALPCNCPGAREVARDR